MFYLRKVIGAATISCDLTQMLIKVVLGLNDDSKGIPRQGLKPSELGQQETLKLAKVQIDKI